jgi:Cu-Zn family superoxide dismutase
MYKIAFPLITIGKKGICMKKSKYVAAVLAAAWSLHAFAAANNESLEVPIHAVNSTGVGASIGTVQITETKNGLVFTPTLSGLPAGTHGFHIHEYPSCQAGIDKTTKVPAAAMAAGGHWDPENTHKHLGPYANQGHRGDLPMLRVNERGEATASVVAPHIKKINEIRGRSLIVHAGGDNFSDTPHPLGGGGPRLACGVIPSR